MPSSANERGYLHEQFRLFHTVDQNELNVDWHFHSFDKLVFFRSGRVEYAVESESFQLRPGDLLVISHGQLHRMRSWPDTPYERYILYLDSAYLSSIAPEAGGLNACFTLARKNGRSLLRFSDAERSMILSLLSRLEKALGSPSPYGDALAHALLTELMVMLCQVDFSQQTIPDTLREDDKIAQALIYIQSHLGEDLSCAALASRLYMSRSSFQHRFKDATGYSPHAYIRLKRLLYASELLSDGEPAVQAGRKSGYTDHSAFCHAFTQQFGMSPSSFRPHSGLTGPEE